MACPFCPSSFVIYYKGEERREFYAEIYCDFVSFSHCDIDGFSSQGCHQVRFPGIAGTKLQRNDGHVFVGSLSSACVRYDYGIGDA